jgi:hypothetical protein
VSVQITPIQPIFTVAAAYWGFRFGMLSLWIRPERRKYQRRERRGRARRDRKMPVVKKK